MGIYPLIQKPKFVDAATRSIRGGLEGREGAGGRKGGREEGGEEGGREVGRRRKDGAH